ncbi:uncharacterized protein LOC133866271 [Alnus glutinosa]|uniref:uncharacterized protein LOC133866271 n=1 Tax=Alnus glutinosa TaxID=3517 RepID=UPI002D7A05DF|nr:uncharacterized protein LOC133866271 [Alnus glutinosa]
MLEFTAVKLWRPKESADFRKIKGNAWVYPVISLQSHPCLRGQKNNDKKSQIVSTLFLSLLSFKLKQKNQFHSRIFGNTGPPLSRRKKSSFSPGNVSIPASKSLHFPVRLPLARLPLPFRLKSLPFRRKGSPSLSPDLSCLAGKAILNGSSNERRASLHLSQAIVDAYKDEPGNPKYAFKAIYVFSTSTLGIAPSRYCIWSMIGHGLGAAGGLEAIASIKAINTGWLHPTIKVVKSIKEVMDSNQAFCNESRRQCCPFNDVHVSHHCFDESELVIFSVNKTLMPFFLCCFCLFVALSAYYGNFRNLCPVV